jgi:hypothetical protein
MSVCGQVVKDFASHPHIVAKAAELLAKGDSVCVILGDGCAVTTTWDGDIRAIAMRVGLDPRDEDGIDRLGYLCWKAGGTVGQPVVAGTLAVTTKG